MHALEQTMAHQFAGARAKHVLGRGRYEQHRTIAVVPGDHVCHIACEQAVAILLGVEEPLSGAREDSAPSESPVA